MTREESTPFAVSRGRFVVALLADPGGPLVPRVLVRKCAEAGRNWKCWPTFTNFIPQWMRPGDVCHAIVTDLSGRARLNPGGDTEGGFTPQFLSAVTAGREPLSTDREIPLLRCYVNKPYLNPGLLSLPNQTQFYQVLFHELRHLLLSTFDHSPDPSQVGHSPPGPWQSWADMDAISVNVRDFLAPLWDLSHKPGGPKIEWAADDAAGYGWDVEGLPPEGVIPLP